MRDLPAMEYVTLRRFQSTLKSGLDIDNFPATKDHTTGTSNSYSTTMASGLRYDLFIDKFMLIKKEFIDEKGREPESFHEFEIYVISRKTRRKRRQLTSLKGFDL